MTIDIAALRALHAATTPGTWHFEPVAGELWCGPNILADISENSDAAFIVAAHNAMPALLDEVESLRAEVVRLKEYEAMYKGLCK